MRKYLILAQPEESYPEQLNSHMFLMMETIQLAKKLNRTFVLPYIHTHMRDPAISESGEIRYEKFVVGKCIDPMNKFFNIDKLRNFVDTIDFDDFIKTVGNKISCLYEFNGTFKDTISIYNHIFSIEKTKRVENIQDIYDIESPIIVLTGCHRRLNGYTNSPNWPEDQNEDYWEIRKNLVFNDNLQKRADEFISKNLSVPYLAIHWRRGDRIHPDLHGDTESLITDSVMMKRCLRYYLIKPAQIMMSKYGLKKVFLATDCGTPWHIEYLKKYLPITRFPGTKVLKDSLGVSIIDQLICVKSKYYFSSPFHYNKCSSFSRWIIDSRKLDGKSDDVSFQEKMRPIALWTYLWRISKLWLKSIIY